MAGKGAAQAAAIGSSSSSGRRGRFWCFAGVAERQLGQQLKKKSAVDLLLLLETASEVLLKKRQADILLQLQQRYWQQ
jgi:hypothetical protein